MHIAVISWGESSEREISLISWKAVLNALKDSGYETSRYDFPTERDIFLQNYKHIDGVMLMIHGIWWEDWQIAWFLKTLHIPFQCVWHSILALTINKRLTKQVWRQYGIPVAKDKLIDMSKEIPSYEWACVLKPLDQGSSVGVYICKNQKSFIEALQKIDQDKVYLMEEYLEGREITVPLIDDIETWAPMVLPIVEVMLPQWKEYTYENKYNGEAKEVCPAIFDEAIVELIHHVALWAYKALNMEKYGRIDMIVTEKWPVCLEINTIPGCTPYSSLPQSAAVYGMSFSDLVTHLVKLMMQNK